jgi:hypothetical protein
MYTCCHMNAVCVILWVSVSKWIHFQGALVILAGSCMLGSGRQSVEVKLLKSPMTVSLTVVSVFSLYPFLNHHFLMLLNRSGEHRHLLVTFKFCAVFWNYVLLNEKAELLTFLSVQCLQYKNHCSKVHISAAVTCRNVKDSFRKLLLLNISSV